MKRLKQLKLTDILIGIVFTLFFISIALIITINFRPLYYLDIKLLDIEEVSGFTRKVIIDNYNALIDYSSPFFKGTLSFPTLPASTEGIQHFKEVKDIFTSFYILAAVTLALIIPISLYKYKTRNYSFLLVSSVTMIIMPLIIGIVLFIDFDTTFIVFHKLFFNNDYWLFDPSTDPVINILPDTFFLHCALLIILLIIIGSIMLLLTYKFITKRTKLNNDEARD